MKIVVRRTGGFAGASVNSEVDTTSLRAHERQGVEALALAALASPKTRPASDPDAFRYHITINGHSVVTDGQSEEWAQLIERIEK